MYTYSLADCSSHILGELVNVGHQDNPYTMDGLYMLPESIQFSGMLLSIEAIGFTTAPDIFQLFVILYHQLHDGSFQFYYKNKPGTSQNEMLETGYIFARADFNVSVTKGDRIVVTSGCGGSCRFWPAFEAINCPAQVLYNADNDIQNLITITNIFLNVRASIGKSHS